MSKLDALVSATGNGYCMTYTECFNTNLAFAANWATRAATHPEYELACGANSATLCDPATVCVDADPACAQGDLSACTCCGTFNPTAATPAVVTPLVVKPRPAEPRAAASSTASCDDSSGCSEDSACDDYSSQCVCCSGSGDGDGVSCVGDADCLSNSNGATKCGTPTIDGISTGLSTCVPPLSCGVESNIGTSTTSISCGGANLMLAAGATLLSISMAI